jgi:mannosyltransferase OCH1-like enzyme
MKRMSIIKISNRIVMANTFIKNYYKIIIVFLVLTLLIFKIQYNKIIYNPTFYDIPFFIEHIDKTSPRVVSDVPLVIYESWKTNNVPEKMKENIYNVCKMNPEFDYYLYDDKACLKFIKENFDQDVVYAFNSLKAGAYKSDLWRYCILYKNGGVYMDIKLYTTEPLINIIKENPVIFVKDVSEHFILTYLPILKNLSADKPCNNAIYNAFMVSPPNNIIFKECIDNIANSCKFKLYKRNPYDITGPCLLGEIVEKYYTADYRKNLKFRVSVSISDFMTTSCYININNRTFIKHYKGYRQEQKYSLKTKYYTKMWHEKDIYKL